MASYEFLLFLAIILITTKFLGLISRKVHMPEVVGALLVGIILGPSFLNFISLDGESGIFLTMLAEIGVISLMFDAGLGTDLGELKKNGAASLVIALLGVLLPLLGGFAGYMLYFHVGAGDVDGCLKAVFIGTVMTATSVSITVETLKEMGKLKGRVGTLILGAAVIDDILGIIVLTIVTSLKNTSVNPAAILLKIVLYFVFLGVVAFLMVKMKPFIEWQGNKRRTAVFAVSVCLLLAYISERFFGIADITGAFFAGIMFCSLKVCPYIIEKTEVLSYLFFSPVFFASIGLKVRLGGMNANIWIFSIILLVIAILSKVIGCGLGARLCKCSSRESLQVGTGMISRGEVALIVAQEGFECGMLDSQLFAPIVFVVIITTLITPVLLKVVMSESRERGRLAGSGGHFRVFPKHGDKDIGRSA